MKAQISLPQYVKDFMSTFQRGGYEIYLVGGALRDMLLSRPTDNWDFATNAKPEDIQGMFPESFYHNEYGTVSVPIKVKHPSDGKTSGVKEVSTESDSVPTPEVEEEQQRKKLIFEITPYRKESGYSDTRHPDTIAWAQTLEEDLARRDFTINALAFDGKKLVDPFDGETDITRKNIRVVGDPQRRFSEDALRLLRAVRLSTQLEFTIEHHTLVAIIEYAQALQHVSWERIRDEFFKILSSQEPAEGILLLRKTGLLSYILPELEACFGVEQKSPGRHHIYDVGTHLVEALRQCPSHNVITRFAALIHDIGKATTAAKDEKTGTITFYNHEIVGAEQTAIIADRLRLSKEQKDILVKLVRYHMFSVSESQTDKAIRRTIRNIGKDHIDDLLAVRVGDRLGSGAPETSWRTEEFKKRLIEVQKVPFSVGDLKIDGNDVMKELKIKPGPRVGETLQKIFEEVDDGKLKNERDELLKKLKESTSN